MYECNKGFSMKNNSKIMYIFRGMPGSGKSTLISKYGLQSNTISLDTFRELFSGTTISGSGHYGIDQKYNFEIMTYFNIALKKRLNEGAPIIVDNLNVKSKDINSLSKVAKDHQYDVKVVDFELKNIAFYFERNKNREERKGMSESVITRIHENFENSDISNCNAEIISVEQFSAEMAISNKELCVNLDAYTKVNHFGDIKATKGIAKNIVDNYKTDEFYIFTGNYFDSGDFIDETIDSLKKISLKENVVFLTGHHDAAIQKMIENDFNSSDNTNMTNVLDYSKIKSHADFLRKFISKTKPFFMYEFNKRNVIVSHAGITNYNEKIRFVNNSTFIEGELKSKDITIDQAYENNNKSSWIQIHGGTTGNSNILEHKSSFSLYENVERGENFVSISLSEKGFFIKKTKNKTPNKELIDSLIGNEYINYNSHSKEDNKIIDISESNKKKNINDVDLHTLGDINIYAVGNNIVYMEKTKKDYHDAILNPEKIFYYTAGYSESQLLLKHDFSLAEGIKIPKQIEEISRENDAFCICSLEESGLKIINVVRKSKSMCHLKKENFNNIKVKSPFIQFNDENKLKAFIKNQENKRSITIVDKNGVLNHIKKKDSLSKKGLRKK